VACISTSFLGSSGGHIHHPPAEAHLAFVLGWVEAAVAVGAHVSVCLSSQ
jgi:hypothetical protein